MGDVLEVLKAHGAGDVGEGTADGWSLEERGCAPNESEVQR